MLGESLSLLTFEVGAGERLVRLSAASSAFPVAPPRRRPPRESLGGHGGQTRLVAAAGMPE